jgi:hypothetical protein
MALTPNGYLRSTSEVQLRDYQHAARLFTDDKFRLLPKSKFLFHVAFNINQAALKKIDLVQRHRNEINMMVKSADLPNFTINVETLNQYNRKKNVVTGHKYNPITIRFNDDNMGLINQLWQNYYSYYFADPTSAQQAGAYNRTATRHSNYITNNYGFDNGSTLPFFNYITIYQMARHEFVSYKLHNPVISSWNHNNVDYSQAGAHDNTVQLQYEAVSYGVGDVVPGDPEGFALEHYDQTPSPLQGLPGETSSPSFSKNQAVSVNAAEYLNNVTTTVNTYQNTQQLSNPGTPGVLSSIISSASQGVSGIQGFAFPQAGTVPPNTVFASPVKLG